MSPPGDPKRAAADASAPGEPKQRRRRRGRREPRQARRDAAGDARRETQRDAPGDARRETQRDAAGDARRETQRDAPGDARRETQRDAADRVRGATRRQSLASPAEDSTERDEHRDASNSHRTEPSERWGTDDDHPAPPIELAAVFPPDAPADDPDPVTLDLAADPEAPLHDDVANLVGIRFVPAGRISWCDAGDQAYAPGQRVVVDTERGQRLGWIATAPSRKALSGRGARRVLRLANERDLRSESAGGAAQVQGLRLAKDTAAALRLPLKVFRVEVASSKLVVYYTADERLDLREFARNVSHAVGMRIELRQLGGRDEAKLVGGIGSCGLTLCCTTWLPEFVPVSIKMAKDQGLVLSPSRVSGQCGRLKCCLVYEQAGYAELRKGLPKLGKRVVSARGEGRVVEVDVLSQRVRVSYGPGDTEMLAATAVKPLFPPGAQPSKAARTNRNEPAPDVEDDDSDDALEQDPSRDPQRDEPPDFGTDSTS